MAGCEVWPMDADASRTALPSNSFECMLTAVFDVKVQVVMVITPLPVMYMAPPFMYGSRAWMWRKHRMARSVRGSEEPRGRM